MEGYINDPKSQYENWEQTNTETGTVNGFRMARVYWSGTSKKSGYETHGFVYVFTDGKIYYALNGQDHEPYNDQTLPLIETAALSFNRKEVFATKHTPKRRR